MSLVTFDELGPVGVITLNRPEARNAINGAMASALGNAIDRLEGDDDLRAGVLTATTTGSEPVFCAGADLRALHRDSPVTPRGGFAGIVTYPRTKPIVAAVDGLATSGGCEIVLSCDLVVASTRSFFAVAEIRWGLAPLAGGLIRLPRLLGRATAMEMILTGRPISAERAYQLGMVSTLTDGDVVQVACERASMIAQFSPEAVRINLEAAHAAATVNEDKLWQVSRRARDLMWDSPTSRESVSTSFERRRD